MKAVLAGYALGCGSGFAVSILIDRSGFLKRGLLPIGSFVSALPIIGVAPIMVMWFGFDWHSKAAVVVVMTFFPMLVNTVSGLAASSAMERDLMRTYAAGYWQTLFKLRVPQALPFIFNALKINSTLALIGAIVAEFFGTPIVGMGFRISTEVGRLNVDMVWAEIAVAAAAGSLFYFALTVIERLVTFLAPVLPPVSRDPFLDQEDHMQFKPLAAGMCALALAALSTASHANDEVTLQLKWVTQAQFAGYYVALENGYYEEAGLDVTIKPGGPDIAPPQVHRRRWSRRDHRLDALRAGESRAWRAACQYRPALQELGHDADLPEGHRHREAAGLPRHDARRLVLRQRVSVSLLDVETRHTDRRRR